MKLKLVNYNNGENVEDDNNDNYNEQIENENPEMNEN